MKYGLSICLMLISVNAFAISFFSEEDVQQQLSADKVIEVNPHFLGPLLPEGSSCLRDSLSRSSRAYVVKKGYKSALYLTRDQIQNLNFCLNL